MTTVVNQEVDRLWSKYWAVQGVKVVHIDNVRKQVGKPLDDFCMRVDHVVFKTTGQHNKTNRIVGIKCRWFGVGGEFHAVMFDTRELIPFEIAKQGLQVVDKWINRDNTK